MGADALRGVKLHCAVHLWDEDLLAKSEDGEWSGFHWDILSKLAARGGFEVELHEHPFGEGHTWQDWLFETIELYDMNVDYWMPTPTRTQRGVFPVFGLFETSTQLAAHAEPYEKEMSWLSIFKPLAPEVWGALLAVGVVTALAYLFVEWGRNEDDLMEGMEDGLYNSLYFSLLTVTGAGTFTPKTWSGKIIAWSWAWCIMLFVSAYTANLAAFLIVKPKGGTEFKSLDEALSMGTKICTWSGTPQTEFLQLYVQQNMPGYTGMRETSKHPMQALADGDCKAAMGAKVEVMVGQRSLGMNPCCTLKSVGEDLTFAEGSWMVKNDYIDKCSVLVRDVLYVLSTALKQEGILTEVYDAYIERKSDINCEDRAALEQRCQSGVHTPTKSSSAGTESDSDSDPDSRRLDTTSLFGRSLKAKAKAAAAAAATGEQSEPDPMGLESFAGMFLVHGILLAGGILCHVGSVCKGRKTSDADAADEEEEVATQEKEDTETAEVARKLAAQRELLLRLNKQQSEIFEAMQAVPDAAASPEQYSGRCILPDRLPLPGKGTVPL